jgi:hypothetical protein
MSSGTSTDQSAPFTAGHFYVLLSMIAATAAVVVWRHTPPAALLLMSGAVLAAGYTAYALHRAVAGLLSGPGDEEPLGARQRELLEQEKALVLRAIKDLEFDFGMKKVSQVDFDDMRGRLRARALLIMEQLERAPQATSIDRLNSAGSSTARRASLCARCQTTNEPDARFCKQCGERLGSVHA